MTLTCHPPFALARTMPLPEMTPRDFPPALSLVREVPMPFSVDDRFHSHAKVLRICLAGRGLWVSGGSWSADHGTNGAVPLHVLLSLGATPELIAELVLADMWTETPEGIEYHDWAFWNSPAAAPESPQKAAPEPVAVPEPERPVRPARAAGARRVALGRVPGLRRRLRERDGDCCRYCARPVLWGAGRAPGSGTWDWLEPGGPASAENVVTACVTCAGRKAGRSLKDSGMTLLAPLPPEKRNNPCNASELEEQDRKPYKRNGNPYTSETAGQKRYTQAQQNDDQDRSKSSSRLGSKPVPVLDSRARKAKPYTAEFRLHVIAAFAAKTLVEITAAEADALTAEVLGRAKDPVPCPISYVLTAIENATSPVARWFPARLAARAPEAVQAPAAPAGVEWCRECDAIDRTVYDQALNRITHCPNCSPKSFAAHVAAASQEAAA